MKRVDKQNGEVFFTKFYSEKTIQSRKLQREVGRDCYNSEGWRETVSVYRRKHPHYQVSDSPLTVISTQFD